MRFAGLTRLQEMLLLSNKENFKGSDIKIHWDWVLFRRDDSDDTHKRQKNRGN